MKLREIIKQLNRSPENRLDVDIVQLGDRVFGCYDIPWAEQNRLVAYWLSCWRCADTLVGIRAYFLDNEFVAISTQPARKSDCVFRWISEAAYAKVKTYVESFAEKDDPDICILDMDEEFGDGYKICYNNQVLPHLKATLHGQAVRILRSKEKNSDNFYPVEILIGEEKQEIDVNELLFSYLIDGDKDEQ